MPAYPPRLIPAGSSVKADTLGKAARGEKQVEEQQSEGSTLSSGYLGVLAAEGETKAGQVSNTGGKAKPWRRKERDKARRELSAAGEGEGRELSAPQPLPHSWLGHEAPAGHRAGGLGSRSPRPWQPAKQS